MPLAAAFGNYFLPLMIGARDVAFPRLNMFGYWVFLLRRDLHLLGFVFGGRARRWLVRLRAAHEHADVAGLPAGRGADFWAVGLIMLGIGSVATAVNFIVTALNMRAPGMTMMKMPVFVWMMLVVAFLTLFAMPPLTAALIQVFMDRNFHTNFFNAAAGGDPAPVPEPFLDLRPSRGVHPDPPGHGDRLRDPPGVLAQAAVRLLGRRCSRASRSASSAGACGRTTCSTGHRPVAASRSALSTMLIAIPDRREDLQLAGDVWGGAVRLATPMLFALGFIAQFTIGGLSGVLHSIVPGRHAADRHLLRRRALPLRAVRRPRVRDLRRHLLLVPEDLRQMLDETPGQVNFWLMVIGFNMTFFPMHFLGSKVSPAVRTPIRTGSRWVCADLTATIGAFIHRRFGGCSVTW
jgi:cytochrome c oxidase subunit 1